MNFLVLYFPREVLMCCSHYLFISFACVSSETHNLRRVFRSGGIPLHRLYRYVRRQRVWFFSRFGLK